MKQLNLVNSESLLLPCKLKRSMSPQALCPSAFSLILFQMSLSIEYPVYFSFVFQGFEGTREGRDRKGMDGVDLQAFSSVFKLCIFLKGFILGVVFVLEHEVFKG